MLEIRQYVANTGVPVPRDCVPTIVVCSIFFPVAWIAVLLRTWTRLRIVKNLGWDDKLMIVAVCFFTIYCSAVINISTRVTANHQFVSFSDLLISINLLTVAEVFYIVTILVLKISLGIFFLRIAVEKWQRMVIYTAVVVSTVYSSAMFFFAVFQCGYYRDALDFVTKRLAHECASRQFTLGMTYTHGALTAITDWTFLLMPIVILRGSLMQRNEKWTVGSILGFAAISGIASLIRIRYISGLGIGNADFFANGRGIAIWSCVEPGVGIIAGSLVTLRPLVRRYVAAFHSRPPHYMPGRRPGLPYLQESQSSTHLRAPETPPPVFLGLRSKKQQDDEEMAINKGSGRWNIRMPTKPWTGLALPNLPMTWFRSRTPSSERSDPEIKRNDPKVEQFWRGRMLRSEKDAAREERARRAASAYRPPIPPKDVPKMPPEKKKRTSGLPLNLFSTSLPSTEYNDQDEELPEMPRDERTREWRATVEKSTREERAKSKDRTREERRDKKESTREDKPHSKERFRETRPQQKSRPKSKKRGSGLPVGLFGSNNDTITSSNPSSSL